MRQLLGGIVLAVGILIMTGSGLCSLAVIGIGLYSGGTGAALPALVIGGIPFAIGFGLFRLGRFILKPPSPRPDDVAKPFE